MGLFAGTVFEIGPKSVPVQLRADVNSCYCCFSKDGKEEPTSTRKGLGSASGREGWGEPSRAGGSCSCRALWSCRWAGLRLVSATASGGVQIPRPSCVSTMTEITKRSIKRKVHHEKFEPQNLPCEFTRVCAI
jgi:hypothetical protein